MSVPVISYSALTSSASAERDEALRALREACLDPGFFVLDRSPLTGERVTRAYAQSRALHQLPEGHQVKTDLERWGSEISRGYSPPFCEPAYEAGSVATCASFDLAMERELKLPLRAAGNLGPNVWPGEGDLPEFRADVYAYYEAARSLATEMFVAFARMLGLPDDTFVQYYGDDSPCTMRMLHYPGARQRATGRSAPPKAGDTLTGISAHTDFEAFTLMHQDAPGLEVLDVHDRWHTPTLQADQNLIVIGDMLERWTNGTLRATRHCVPLSDHERHSLIVFCAVDDETVVEPLAAFVSPERPAGYTAVTQGEHLGAAVAAALDNRDTPAPAGPPDRAGS